MLSAKADPRPHELDRIDITPARRRRCDSTVHGSHSGLRRRDKGPSRNGPNEMVHKLLVASEKRFFVLRSRIGRALVSNIAEEHPLPMTKSRRPPRPFHDRHPRTRHLEGCPNCCMFAVSFLDSANRYFTAWLIDPRHECGELVLLSV
jgi:hypothetical protein